MPSTRVYADALCLASRAEAGLAHGHTEARLGRPASLKAAKQATGGNASRQSLSQYGAAFGLSNQPFGIVPQQEALFHQARGGSADSGNVLRV